MCHPPHPLTPRHDMARWPGWVCKICILHSYSTWTLFTCGTWSKWGRNNVLFSSFHLLLIIIKFKSTTKNSPTFGQDLLGAMRVANGLQWCYVWTLTSWPDIMGHWSHTNDYLKYSRLSEKQWKLHCCELLGCCKLWRWWGFVMMRMCELGLHAVED